MEDSLREVFSTLVVEVVTSLFESTSDIVSIDVLVDDGKYESQADNIIGTIRIVRSLTNLRIVRSVLSKQDVFAAVYYYIPVAVINIATIIS